MRIAKQIHRKLLVSGIGLLVFLLLGLVATRTWVSHNKTETLSESKSSHVAASNSRATNNLVSARASVARSNALNSAVLPPSPGERTKTPGADRAPGDTRKATVLDGQKVAAEVKVGNKTHQLLADGDQPFQRVYIKPEEKIEIALTYSTEEVGDPVVIQVEDGGSLDDGKMALVRKLDANKSLAFAFKASPFEGIHRVRLWKGAVQKMLDFWAGEPLPVAGQQ